MTRDRNGMPVAGAAIGLLTAIGASFLGVWSVLRDEDGATLWWVTAVVSFALAGILLAVGAVRTIKGRRGAHPGADVFNFIVETLRDGQVVRTSDLHLKVEGRYSGEVPGHVRVILEDTTGHFFLQNPAVRFSTDGTWTAPNVRPGESIEVVHFVRVDNEAESRFHRMVERQDFGAFDALPENSRILRSVRIARV